MASNEDDAQRIPRELKEKIEKAYHISPGDPLVGREMLISTTNNDDFPGVTLLTHW